MATPEKKNGGVILANIMLALGLGGGTPYIYFQQKDLQVTQHELIATREIVIRLEEQNRNLSQQLARIEQEQHDLRRLLNDAWAQRK